MYVLLYSPYEPHYTLGPVPLHIFEPREAEGVIIQRVGTQSPASWKVGRDW